METLEPEKPLAIDGDAVAVAFMNLTVAQSARFFNKLGSYAGLQNRVDAVFDSSCLDLDGQHVLQYIFSKNN